MPERIYHLTINSRDYTIEVESFDGSQAVLRCNDTDYTIDVKDVERIGAPKPAAAAPAAAAPAAAPAAAAPAPTAGAGTVAAPIPGSVLAILVKEGDAVKAGQPVMKMEAMKMENEINATSDGTVNKIHVSQGESVAQGAPLMDIG